MIHFFGIISHLHLLTEMQVKESKWLVKCFLNYLRHEKTEVNVLFEILSIFLLHTRIDYTFLKEFYIIEVFRLGTDYPDSVICLSSMHIMLTKNLHQQSSLSGC